MGIRSEEMPESIPMYLVPIPFDQIRTWTHKRVARCGLRSNWKLSARMPSIGKNRTSCGHARIDANDPEQTSDIRSLFSGGFMLLAHCGVAL